MLPVEVSEPSEEKYSREILMNYEPNEQEALNQIIPKYVTSLFYGALVEAVASETVPACRPWIPQQAMRKR